MVKKEIKSNIPIKHNNKKINYLIIISTFLVIPEYIKASMSNTRIYLSI